MTRRRSILVAALAAAALLAWWLVRPGGGADARRAAPVERARPNPALDRFPALRAIVVEAPRGERAGLHLLADPDLPVVVADYLIASRFPPHSRPLEPGQLDLIEWNRRNETLGPVEHADRTLGPEALRVLLTGDKFRLLGDEPLHVWLELTRDGTRVPVRVVAARVYAAEIFHRAPVGDGIALAFTPDPSGVQTATFSVAGTPLAKHTGYVHVEVTYDYGGAQHGVEAFEVYVQPLTEAPARFTGRFREELVAGSLTIHAEVEVDEPGAYVLDANLFDADEQPTAFVRAKLDLTEGTHEVPFLLHGRIVHEQGARAPFTLTDLRGYRFLLGEDPDRRHLPDAGVEHRTAAYPRDAFSADEFWDDDKQQQVDRLLRDAAAGQHQLLNERLGDAPERGWTPAI